MMKGRYRHLSPEAKDRIMESLSKMDMRINGDTINEVQQELYEDDISTSYIRFITHVKDLQEVIDNNEQLTKNFTGFIRMHGFEDLYDMYLYAMSCDTVPEHIAKGKDYSKLTPVKRKVTRNGVEREVTVYVKPGEDAEPEEGQTESKGKGGGGSNHVKGAKPRVVGKDKKPDPKEIIDIMQLVKDFPGASRVSESLDIYILFEKDGEVLGIAGFTVQETYVKLEGFASNGEASGVGARSFFEGIKLALDLQRNFKVFDEAEAAPLFEKYGLEKTGNEWTVRYKLLQQTFEE
jgi:hypothetical protein